LRRSIHDFGRSIHDLGRSIHHSKGSIHDFGRSIHHSKGSIHDLERSSHHFEGSIHDFSDSRRYQEDNAIKEYMHMTNEHKDPSKGLEPFKDYTEFEDYVLKRMADELGTQLEGEDSIRAITKFLSKIEEEHKDYLE